MPALYEIDDEGMYVKKEVNTGTFLRRSSEIAVAIDIERWVIIKHGPAMEMMAWYKTYVEYKKTGMLNHIILIHGKIPPKALNQAIVDEGSVKDFARRFGIFFKEVLPAKKTARSGASNVDYSL
jgi:hypothetical protein